MTALESRKQLLIAESELNRMQLVIEGQSVARDVHALTRQAKTMSSMASAVTILVGGIISWRRTKKATRDSEKISWWQKLLKGASMASSFWMQMRSADRNRKED
jgi:hypothetical protein